jgi:hypothetical protein
MQLKRPITPASLHYIHYSLLHRFTFHSYIPFCSVDRRLAQILKQIAALEILIRMNDRLELRTRPRPVVFDLLDLAGVDVFEDSV